MDILNGKNNTQGILFMKYIKYLWRIGLCSFFCCMSITAFAESKADTTTTASSTFVLGEHFPYKLQKPIKPFYLVYKAVADIGIRIGGTAWERLSKKNNKWLYETRIGALGSWSGEQLLFTLDADNHFQPIIYTITDSVFGSKRTRSLAYDAKNMTVTFHDTDDGEQKTFAWVSGSLDPLSMRFIVSFIMAAQPHILTLEYDLIQDKKIKPYVVPIERKQINTLAQQRIDGLTLQLEKNGDKLILLTLAPSWHYLPVLITYGNKSFDVILEIKHIDYDGVTFLRTN